MADTRTTASLKDIQELVQKIVKLFRPSKVVLFGSYAYGEPHEDSDIDFLIVTPTPPSMQEARKVTYEFRQQTSLPVQIIFMDPEAFEETKDIVGGVAYPAHHWGRVLYEANP